MPLQRLRRVLEANYRVRIESSNNLLAKVNRRVQKRRDEFIAKGAQPPVFKNATVLNALRGQRDWNIRAIDLLHKIGFLTTPSWVNMARLSASWATRRYFWAIAEPTPHDLNLRLSDDARRMDFHQKTLLSDEFGIGMAGLLMETFFGAPAFVDISIALDDPAVYQDIEQTGDAQPDYLMWGEQGNSPYYVVECKGSQSSDSTSYDQMRRGLEQVPSITFGAGARQIVTVIVATCMMEHGTDVFVLDPPSDPPDEESRDKKPMDEVSERTGKRSWRIRDPEAFEERTRIAEESNLLRWAGQHQTAVIRDRRLERPQAQSLTLPNAPLERRATDFGNFRGIDQPLFPELGSRDLRIFTGVDEELLDLLVQERPPEKAIAVEAELRRRLERQRPPDLPQNMSVSRGGSCMIVDGI